MAWFDLSYGERPSTARTNAQRTHARARTCTHARTHTPAGWAQPLGCKLGSVVTTTLASFVEPRVACTRSVLVLGVSPSAAAAPPTSVPTHAIVEVAVIEKATELDPPRETPTRCENNVLSPDMKSHT